MRYKVAPPVDRETLVATHEAVPLVPGSTDDCCARIRKRVDLPTRDDAETWLVFLDALELVERTDRGYRRRRRDVDPDALATPFREQVYGVQELLAALADADDPLSADAAFERLRGEIPDWERNRHADWEATWRERVRRLLEWAVFFDLAERVDGRFR